jgi:plastocyanin
MRVMKREYIFFVIVVVMVGLGFWIFKNDKQQEPLQDRAVAEQGRVEGEEVKAEDNVVIYTNAGFSPRSLTVAVGTTVKFVDQASKPMWVASDPHPTHGDYSAFDQLRGGSEYSFTFTESGSYPFHNHLVPADTGVVVVE